MFAVVLGPLSARRHVAAPRGDCRSWSLHGYCACWRTVFHLWWPNGDSFNVTPAVRCWTISLHLFVWKDRFVIPILLVPFKNTRIPVCSNCAPVSVFFSFEQLYCSTNPKEKAAISFAFVRSDTYTCGIAEARESCSALQYGLAQLRHRRRFNRRIVQQYGSDVDWRQAGYCWYTRVCAYAVSI